MDRAEGVERADARHSLRLDRFAHADAADGRERKGLVAAIFADSADENGASVLQLCRIAAKPRPAGFFCHSHRHANYNSLILSLSKDVQRNRVARKCKAEHAGIA